MSFDDIPLDTTPGASAPQHPTSFPSSPARTEGPDPVRSRVRALLEKRQQGGGLTPRSSSATGLAAMEMVSAPEPAAAQPVEQPHQPASSTDAAARLAEIRARLEARKQRPVSPAPAEGPVRPNFEPEGDTRTEHDWSSVAAETGRSSAVSGGIDLMLPESEAGEGQSQGTPSPSAEGGQEVEEQRWQELEHHQGLRGLVVEDLGDDDDSAEFGRQAPQQPHTSLLDGEGNEEDGVRERPSSPPAAASDAGLGDLLGDTITTAAVIINPPVEFAHVAASSVAPLLGDEKEAVEDDMEPLPVGPEPSNEAEEQPPVPPGPLDTYEGPAFDSGDEEEEDCSTVRSPTLDTHGCLELSDSEVGSPEAPPSGMAAAAALGTQQATLLDLLAEEPPALPAMTAEDVRALLPCPALGSHKPSRRPNGMQTKENPTQAMWFEQQEDEEAAAGAMLASADLPHDQGDNDQTVIIWSESEEEEEELDKDGGKDEPDSQEEEEELPNPRMFGRTGSSVFVETGTVGAADDLDSLFHQSEEGEQHHSDVIGFGHDEEEDEQHQAEDLEQTMELAWLEQEEEDEQHQLSTPREQEEEGGQEVAVGRQEDAAAVAAGVARASVSSANSNSSGAGSQPYIVTLPRDVNPRATQPLVAVEASAVAQDSPGLSGAIAMALAAVAALSEPSSIASSKTGTAAHSPQAGAAVANPIPLPLLDLGKGGALASGQQSFGAPAATPLADYDSESEIYPADYRLLVKEPGELQPLLLPAKARWAGTSTLSLPSLECLLSFVFDVLSCREKTAVRQQRSRVL